jgi:hypothetical protein
MGDMQTTLRLMLFGASLSAAPAFAADTERPVTPIDGRDDCRREESMPVAFRELATNIEAYAGKCIIVRGMTSGYFFYGGIEDYYRFNNSSLERDRPTVGLYAPNEEAREQLFGRRQSVELVALANTCAHLSAFAHKDDDKRKPEHTMTADGEVELVTIVMLTGYCHYTDEPVLHVSEFRILDPGPLRLTGDDARRALGDSDDLQPDTPIYAEATSRIRQWFDAVRRRDIVGLWGQSWHRYNTDIGDKEEWPTSIFWDKDTPLRFLFGRPSLPPIKYYVARISAEEQSKGEYVVSGCICRTPDCTGRWPIHSSDASISPAWPYACMWVHRREDGMLIVGGW